MMNKLGMKKIMTLKMQKKAENISSVKQFNL